MSNLIERLRTAYYIQDTEDEQVNEVMRELAELCREAADRLEGLERFKRSVDEALNSGDGSYRP